jgi:hypothetical protein
METTIEKFDRANNQGKNHDIKGNVANVDNEMVKREYQPLRPTMTMRNWRIRSRKTPQIKGRARQARTFKTTKPLHFFEEALSLIAVMVSHGVGVGCLAAYFVFIVDTKDAALAQIVAHTTVGFIF